MKNVPVMEVDYWGCIQQDCKCLRLSKISIAKEKLLRLECLGDNFQPFVCNRKPSLDFFNWLHVYLDFKNVCNRSSYIFNSLHSYTQVKTRKKFCLGKLKTQSFLTGFHSKTRRWLRWGHTWQLRSALDREHIPQGVF